MLSFCSRPASAKASAPLPAADFGFGESAFAPPGAPAAAATAQPPTKPGSREFVDMADAGRSISFRDSYPTGLCCSTACILVMIV